MATASYYRKQADTCLQMARVCSDPVLTQQLDLLAAEFLEAAADQDGESTLVYIGNVDQPVGRKQARG